MKGIKHIIECHCVLPQYKNVAKPVYHKFIVFSIIDDSETIIPKHASCNNCGVIHNVYDVCKSEILPGKELGAVMQIEDCKLMLPSSINSVLENYNRSIEDYEHALFILQNKKWGDWIVVNREEEDGTVSGKILKISGPGQYRIEPFTLSSMI